MFIGQNLFKVLPGTGFVPHQTTHIQCLKSLPHYIHCWFTGQTKTFLYNSPAPYLSAGQSLLPSVLPLPHFHWRSGSWIQAKSCLSPTFPAFNTSQLVHKSHGWQLIYWSTQLTIYDIDEKYLFNDPWVQKVWDTQC